MVVEHPEHDAESSWFSPVQGKFDGYCGVSNALETYIPGGRLNIKTYLYNENLHTL